MNQQTQAQKKDSNERKHNEQPQKRENVCKKT